MYNKKEERKIYEFNFKPNVNRFSFATYPFVNKIDTLHDNLMVALGLRHAKSTEPLNIITLKSEKAELKKAKAYHKKLMRQTGQMNTTPERTSILEVIMHHVKRNTVKYNCNIVIH